MSISNVSHHSKLFITFISTILITASAIASADTAIKLPKQYNPSMKWPVVILLHGAGATGNMQDLHFGLSERVSTKGFIMATPEATTDRSKKITTNSDILKLIKDLKSNYSIDSSRLYLFGQSMGGFAAQRFACDHGDQVAGIVVSSAYGSCASPVAPVSVILATGDADVSDRKVRTFNQSWLRNNGCTAPPSNTLDMDLQWDVVGAESSATIWEDCRNGTSVVSLRAKFGRHVPIFRAGFTNFVLDQLLAASNSSHRSIAESHKNKLSSMKSSECFDQEDDRGRFVSSQFLSNSIKTRVEISEHQNSGCNHQVSKVIYLGPPAKNNVGSIYGIKLERVAVIASTAQITNDLNGNAGRLGLCDHQWRINMPFEAKGNNFSQRRSCIASMGSHLGASSLVKRLLLSYAFSPPLP